MLKRGNVSQTFSGAHILLFRMVLQAFLSFQTAHHQNQLLTNVCTDSFALSIIHPLQHELQHLVVCGPQPFRLLRNLPVAHVGGLPAHHKERLCQISLFQFGQNVVVIHVRVLYLIRFRPFAHIFTSVIIES